MPLIELVVAMCLITDPGTCKEQHFYFTEHTSLMSCMMQAQPFLADWTRTNGQWKIEEWHCENPATKDRKA